MKNVTTIIAIGILGILFLASCEKKPIDFRSDFVGNWEFIIISRAEVQGVEDPMIDTTIYEGLIEYSEGIKDILISYTAIHSMTCRINEVGELTNCSERNCVGNFEGTDSLQFFYYWGGLGASGSRKVMGNKK